MVLTLIAILAGIGCQKSSDAPATGDANAAQQGSNSAQIFSDSLGSFTVRVYYEPSAVPYVGNIGLTANNTWDITKVSYQALFQNHVGRLTFVPTTLGQMFPINAQNKTTWTAMELIDLGRRTAPPLMSGNDATVSVIFLKGTYKGDASLLGVQFTGYPFAFVFKDVVTATGGDGVSQRYVEQATVVHEVGHAVGLVNNGVPMVSPHEDSAHPHHSTNANCAMHWSIESKGSILTALAAVITGNQLQLFGSQSLQDGRNFHSF